MGQGRFPQINEIMGIPLPIVQSLKCELGNCKCGTRPTYDGCVKAHMYAGGMLETEVCIDAWSCH